MTFGLRTGKDQRNEHSRDVNTVNKPWVNNELDMFKNKTLQNRKKEYITDSY